MACLLEYSESSLKEVYADKFDAETDAEVYYENGEIYSKNNWQDSTELGPREISYLEGSKRYPKFSVEYTATSNDDFEFYVLPSKEEVNNFAVGKNFQKYTECDLEAGICEGVKGGAVLMIYNPTNNDIVVDVDYDFIYPYDSSELFADNSYAFYNIGGETCVVLETTAGKFGFVGFSSEDLEGDKQAFNPRTYEYFLLG